jgi:hypothetical protein
MADVLVSRSLPCGHRIGVDRVEGLGVVWKLASTPQPPLQEHTMHRRFLALAIAAVTAGSLSTGAFAETQWQKDHPRRTEVNARLANQDQRIHNEVKEGEISRSQAAALHREDRQIRGEERAMASHDRGHITKADQTALNQQENAVSRQIGK